MLKLVFADGEGQVREYRGWSMTGRLGEQLVEPTAEEVIPLPAGATLVLLPQRYPVGINRAGQFKAVTEHPLIRGRQKLSAVGALLPQGYTRTLVPGFIREKGAPVLPLFGYAAVGFKDGQFWVAALKTDEDRTWNPKYYNTADLPEKVAAKLGRFPENRVLGQLARCAQEYACFTAQNLFYGRWEAGIPFTPVCNARCVGCISEQVSECCPSPQQRISFKPTVGEVVELAAPHLQEAEAAILSFGQGCEGEPSLRGDELATAITRMRRQTSRGTINMNSNAGRPEAVEKMAKAGLDALRVSLASARPELYNLYHRPQGYGLAQVRESIQRAVARGVRVSLNLLHFPGINDREEEIEALLDLVQTTGVSLIQIRNLNLDPEVYLQLVPPASGSPLGVPDFLRILAQELPAVAVGNYTREVSK